LCSDGLIRRSAIYWNVAKSTSPSSAVAVLDHERFGLGLLAAPIVYDRGPIYYSYVIVPSGSHVTRF